jgi:hypothetical protein
MGFRDNFLKPASLFIGLAISVFICLIAFSAPESFGYVVSFFGVLILLVYLTFLSYIFQQGASGSFLSRFLRVNQREKINYNRIMGAIGEILISSTILAIAVGFSNYFDSAGFTIKKIFLAIFTVVIVLVTISFSITTLLIHCLNNNISKFTNFRRQVFVGGILLVIASFSVSFGVVSGKGISTYYIQMYSDNN